jgi:spermidine synthase
LLTLTLAFLSGIPALVYQVVWTREIALLAGSQIEAISVVLVAFFGGLAVDARAFGGIVDRFSSWPPRPPRWGPGCSRSSPPSPSPQRV